MQREVKDQVEIVKDDKDRKKERDKVEAKDRDKMKHEREKDIVRSIQMSQCKTSR